MSQKAEDSKRKTDWSKVSDAWNESYCYSDFRGLLSYKGEYFTREVKQWSEQKEHGVFH